MAMKCATLPIHDKEGNNFKLPPFLMIRSGVANEMLAFWFSLTVIFEVVNKYIDNAHFNGDALYVVKFMLYIAWILSVFSTTPFYSTKRKNMEQVATKIVDDIKQFATGKSEKLNLDAGSYPKMMMRIIKYIAKNNPVLFDKLMQDPNSVPNSKVFNTIITEYVRKNSHYARKVLDKISRDYLDTKTYNMLIRYAERLKAFEKR